MPIRFRFRVRQQRVRHDDRWSTCPPTGQRAGRRARANRCRRLTIRMIIRLTIVRTRRLRYNRLASTFKRIHVNRHGRRRRHRATNRPRGRHRRNARRVRLGHNNRVHATRNLRRQQFLTRPVHVFNLFNLKAFRLSRRHIPHRNQNDTVPQDQEHRAINHGLLIMRSLASMCVETGGVTHRNHSLRLNPTTTTVTRHSNITNVGVRQINNKLQRGRTAVIRHCDTAAHFTRSVKRSRPFVVTNLFRHSRVIRSVRQVIKRNRRLRNFTFLHHVTRFTTVRTRVRHFNNLTVFYRLLTRHNNIVIVNRRRRIVLMSLLVLLSTGHISNIIGHGSTSGRHYTANRTTRNRGRA